MSLSTAKDEVVLKICKAARDAENAGISVEDIFKCLNDERKSISSPSHDSSSVWGFTSFKLISGVLLVSLLHFPVLKFLYDSSCILPTPDLLIGMITPLANCSVCEGVMEAPRLVNLTRKEFAIHHAHSSRPIVVVEAAMNWPAMQVLSYDYFKTLYHKYPEAIDADSAKGQFFSYSSNIRNLKDLFELSSEQVAMITDKWYIGW